MSYDALVIAAHADDAETQMGGTLAQPRGPLHPRHSGDDPTTREY